MVSSKPSRSCCWKVVNRWVIRWFRSEWQDAWVQSGKATPILSKVKIKVILWINRIVVRLLASLPGEAAVVDSPRVDLEVKMLGSDPLQSSGDLDSDLSSIDCIFPNPC